jgi:imidazolonepropionase-like amidohydrolase
MPSRSRLGTIRLAAAVLACLAPRAAPAQRPLVLQGGTLVNPGVPPVPNAIVVLRGAQIVCAGPSGPGCRAPGGARAVDARGLYVAPGLIDAHVHYSQTGWVDGRPDAVDLRASRPYDSVVAALEAHPERYHRAYLCSGITSVFDVGGYPWTFALARATVGAADAPRVVAAGPLLSTVDHWLNLSDMRQFVYMGLGDSVVRATVRAHARFGAGAIKVWNIDVPDSLSPRMVEMLKAAGDESRKVGLPLIVHATSLARAREAVAAGAAVLVHNVDEDTLDAEFVSAAKRAGTIVIPTLTVLEGYQDVLLGRSPASRYPLDCVDPTTRRELETAIPDSVRKITPERAERIRQRIAKSAATSAENLRKLHAAGVPIAAGTDAGNPGTAHGPSIYRELEAMQADGMAAAEVFRSATIVAARAMGLEREVGSVEAGKRADLVLFGADPSADARNMRDVRLVIRNGVLYPRAKLLAAAAGGR